MTNDISPAEAGILARHGMTTAQVADAALLAPDARTPAQEACLTELLALWNGETPEVIEDAAVTAISEILVTLPLIVRCDVVERAFAQALPEALGPIFEAEFGNPPTPTLLIGGEVASDALRVTGEALASVVNADTIVTLIEDGDVERGIPDEVNVMRLGEFFDRNEMTHQERATISACLAVGEEWVAGGGAAPIWWLKVSDEADAAELIKAEARADRDAEAHAQWMASKSVKGRQP